MVAHPSADVDALAVAMVRGAYEYQGQKCSAASRAYIPDTLWPAVRDRVVAMIEDIRMGDVADFRNFMGAVIDRRAFNRIRDYLERARSATRASRSSPAAAPTTASGYFIQPTLLQVEDPKYRTMCEEIFGPVLTVHVYPAARWTETLALVDRTSPYALTGAVFAPRPRGPGRGRPGAAERRRQLLHQRQADRRGGGPAAVRRCPRQRHQRQGGLDAQPAALGLPAEHQGDARPAQGLPLPVHGGGVGSPWRVSADARALVRAALRRRRAGCSAGQAAPPPATAVPLHRRAARLRHLPRKRRAADSRPRPARRIRRETLDPDGVLRSSGHGAGDGVAIEAWYDSLALSRESPETTSRPTPTDSSAAATAAR